MKKKIKEKQLFDRQLIQLNKDLNKATLENNLVLKSKAYDNLGKLYFSVKDYKEGLIQFEKAIELARELKNREMEAQYLGSKGTAFLNHDLPEEGYLCFKKILQIAEDINNIALQGDALGSMALVHLQTGDPGLAVEKLKKALAFAEELKDRKRTMIQIGTLGNTYLHLAAKEEAENYFRRAIEIAEEIGDKESQAGYLNNFSIILEKTGRLIDARHSLEKVREISREIKDLFGELHAVKRLVIMEMENNPQNELLLLYLKRAIELSRKLDDKNEESYFSDLYISVLLGMNRQKEAVEVIEKELERIGVTNPTERQLLLLSNLGDAYYNMGNLDLAMLTYHKGKKISKELDSKKTEAKLFGRIGAVYADLGDIINAKTNTDKSLQYAIDLEDKNLEAEQLSMLAMVHMDLGQPNEAKECADRALQIYDDSGQKVMAEKVRSFLDEFAK